MITIAVRTVLIYFLLFIVIRCMGKRQIGELQASEFIITILLSEIASAPVTNPNLALGDSVLSVFILLALELSVSALLLRFNSLKKLFYGSPSIVVCRGKIDIAEMRRNRMEIDELMAELRQAGYSDLNDVNYAILEDNGKLSVFPKASKAPLTPEDLSVNSEERGISHICVLDGRIAREGLRAANWDENRLTAELSSRRLSLPDVFLFTVDDTGKICCVKKEDAKG
ncbi:MAG: DUF421 domain-containing protein [Ruminococcaceae bacterium]|nr:DUF421 domain-containing protein [Oscillospiraceae bacterium]